MEVVKDVEAVMKQLLKIKMEVVKDVEAVMKQLLKMIDNVPLCMCYEE